MSLAVSVTRCAGATAMSLFLIGGCRSASPLKYETLSVCELVRLGAEMDGKPVRIKAVFVSDNRHFAALIDQTCRNAALTLSLSDALDRDKSVDALKKLIYSPAPDYVTDPLRWGVGITLSLDISGQFQWRPSDERPGQLIVEKMWSWKRLPQAATK
jgi:hypothetical protein